MKPIASCLFLATLSTLALASNASADIDQTPPSGAAAKARPVGVISLGVARVIEDTHDRNALALEGSRQFGEGHAYLHAELAISERDSEYELVSGRFEHVRAGLEGRTDGRMVRAFAGVDLGIAFEQTTVTSVRDYTQMSRLDSSFITVPRAGVEVGERFLARMSLEAIIAQHDGGRDGSLGMSIAVGAAF